MQDVPPTSTEIPVRERTAQERQQSLSTALATENVAAISATVQQLYDCSMNEASSIADVLRIGKNRKNPTMDSLVKNILDSMREKQPLDLWVSQCIGKKPEVRLHKIDFYCKSEDEKPREITLSEGAVDMLEAKCWLELRQIQDAVNAHVTLLLGDQDFFTLDAIDEWASSETIERLSEEIDVLLNETNTKAADYFANRISVSRWTSLYDKPAFMAEFQKAKATKDAWLTGKFKRASVRPYMHSWGYPGIAQSRGIPEEILAQFIEDDIIRTAAQYRVEARIAMQRKVVQCWAETCGDPSWPITISNYDKEGVAPSISLL